MPDLLRFAGAVAHEPAIDRWIDSRPGPLARIARTWFLVMRECGSDVVELMNDGHPVVCVDDAPFAYVNAFTAHVNVGFFQGYALPDPARILLGTGKFMRHVKLKPDVAVDSSALEALIVAARLDILDRLIRVDRPIRPRDP